MAIHCESVSEQTNPSASPETRWIAASLATLSPRNDKDRDTTEPHTAIPSTPCHREGVSPWRSTVSREAISHCPYAPIACSGLPRPSLRSLLAMTNCAHYYFFPFLVIARAKPVAIHCEPVSKPYCPYAPIVFSGLPRRPLPLPPRKDINPEKVIL